jgi:hypothetical protein
MIYVLRPAGGKWWLEWETVVLRVFAVACVLMVAYEGAHYATTTVVHDPGYCCASRTHMFGGRRAPRWVDTDFFWFADQIDDLFQ